MATHITYNARACERSMLARQCEKPRTLADALKLWLAGSHNSTISPAARAVIAARIERAPP